MVLVEISQKEIQALEEVFNTARVNLPIANVVLGFKQKVFTAWKAEQESKEAASNKKAASKKKPSKR